MATTRPGWGKTNVLSLFTVMPLTYEQLRQWRDLCEFLAGQWYRCAEPYDISKALPGCHVSKPESRSERQYLWDNWEIQLMSWGGHPAAWYSNSGYREFKKWRGWALCPGWEVKIDFLEKVVLFDADPEVLEKPWKEAIAQARAEKLRQQLLRQQEQEEQRRRREQREAEYRAERERWNSLSPEEQQAERDQREQEIVKELMEREEKSRIERVARVAKGLCQWCGVATIPLMMDCVDCGKSYE